jgi:AcrR family transcriptional regulator
MAKGPSRREVPEKLPKGRGALPQEIVHASQRRRLLAAMAELAGTKGIVELTISDVVTRAGVARRSFYELFDDKADCFIATYTFNAQVLIDYVAAEMRAAQDPADSVPEGMRAYLERLSEYPTYARAFLLEPLRAGPVALEHRQRIHGDFVKLFMAGHRRARKANPELERVSRNSVIALVGAINELAYQELVRTKEPNLNGLLPEVLAVTRAILGLRKVTSQAN